MPSVNKHNLTFHRLTEKGRTRACCQVQPVKPPARVFGDLHSSGMAALGFLDTPFFYLIIKYCPHAAPMPPCSLDVIYACI